MLMVGARIVTKLKRYFIYNNANLLLYRHAEERTAQGIARRGRGTD